MNTARIFATILMLAIGACGKEGKEGDTPENARGDTPVKYIVCNIGGKDCIIAARFKDLSSCESHKEIDNSACDRKSTPGKIVCTKDQSSISVTYCTL